MKTSTLRQIIKEEIDNTLNESTSYKQFQILIGALSKYKNHIKCFFSINRR
jgi:hypothetical protein